MKKRIFFLLHAMHVGGIEKALLRVLDGLPSKQWEVHVGLVRKEGELMESLPKEVQVHEIPCLARFFRVAEDSPEEIPQKSGCVRRLKSCLTHAGLAVYQRLSSNKYWIYRFLLRNEPVFPMEFDVAVAFAGPSQMLDYYICEKVRAKEKHGWIHYDVSQYGINRGITKRLYPQYDKIMIVSEKGKEIFDRMFPQLACKTEVFYFKVPQEQVVSMAENGPTFDDHFEGKRILTVGRLSEEKGQRVAIEVLKMLVDRGHQVKWYFVGDGPDKEYCQALAQQLGVAERVVFLGVQANPYGFMKDCDIYVQPSRHEGFCITLAEALCFPHPIVATDFTGAREQLQGRSNGFVTGMTAEEICLTITSFNDNVNDLIQLKIEN